jgi:lambda repressor-like predicted transcriptional regulator
MLAPWPPRRQHGRAGDHRQADRYCTLILNAMKATQVLTAALKAELRRAGITYAQLAVHLELAESSVKRIFSRGELTLARIDQVLALLQLDFVDLAREVAQATPARQTLSAEQEAAVVADPHMLLVAICVQARWTAAQILETYAITSARLVAALTALDRLGFIELRAHNRYRLKVDQTFRWQPDGPVMAFFRRHAVPDYFEGGFDDPGEHLAVVHGQIAHARAAVFHDRLQSVAQDFVHQHVADQTRPADDKTAYTLVLGMRSWLFEPFRALLRTPDAAPGIAPRTNARR